MRNQHMNYYQTTRRKQHGINTVLRRLIKAVDSVDLVPVGQAQEDPTRSQVVSVALEVALEDKLVVPEGSEKAASISMTCSLLSVAVGQDEDDQEDVAVRLRRRR